MAEETSPFWPTFGNTSASQEVICEDEGSLAVRVLNKYDIMTVNDRGGDLLNLDIAHMDAGQVVKMSLLEDSIDNSRAPYEAFVNYGSNSVEFKEVGSYLGGVTDIYHTVQTGTYIEECSGVLVTGEKPMVYRKETVWQPIWGAGENAQMEIYQTTDMKSNCNKPNFDSHVTIAYRDPHLNSTFNDGIDNLYEITNANPYDEVIGYAVRKYSAAPIMQDPSYAADVTITDSKQCSIPMRISTGNLGTLVRRPTVPGDLVENPACWVGQAKETENVEKGVAVPIPEMFRYSTFHDTLQDNFIRISQVYVVGVDLQHCYGKPKDDAAAIKLPAARTAADFDIWVSLKNNQARIISLEEGVEYTVGFIEGDVTKTPYIVFANNSKDYDKAAYGTGAKYNIYPHCQYAQGKDTSILRNQDGSILPIGGNAGIIVHEVWAVIDLETPSIVVHDPHGEALTIAQQLEYSLLPLVIVNEPAPIGYAGILNRGGRLVKQEESKQDHDPTTQQDLEDTDFEIILDSMDAGGGLSLNLSFLDAEGAWKLAGVLYNYMNGLDGVETVYSCGPNCNPLLGGTGPAGGIINSITHQYSDSGSYTVSCNESGRLLGNFSDITGGPYVKASESPSVPGTVIQDEGNHIFFKVRVDGFGERIAVNACSSVIRVGDRVSCTIHNNPIEL